jgi:hypothetical protein
LASIQGVRDVVHLCHAVVRRGPFAVLLFGHHMAADVQVTLSTKLREVFEDLRRMIRNECTEHESLSLCSQAVEGLQRTYENVVYFSSARKLEMGQIWSWVAVDNDYGFIKLVQQSYPPALVITAHFCVLTVMMQDTWFVSNWGRYAFDGILLALDGRLGHTLSWVHEQLAMDLPDLRYDTGTIKRAEDHSTSPASAGPVGTVAGPAAPGPVARSRSLRHDSSSNSTVATTTPQDALS